LESNWRWNVLDFDGTYSDVELFARLVVPPVPGYNYLMKVRGFENVFFAKVVSGQFTTYTGGALPDPATPHFPWGYEVDPD